MNTIKRDTTGQDELAADPVWDLLRQSPSVVADPAFADRELRAVRLQEKPQALWDRQKQKIVLRRRYSGTEGSE